MSLLDEVSAQWLQYWTVASRSVVLIPWTKAFKLNNSNDGPFGGVVDLRVSGAENENSE